MLKKIVSYLIITLITAIFVSYFYFASSLKAKGDETEICKDISVVILDSNLNRFVSIAEVKDILVGSNTNPLGVKVGEIDLYRLEKLLNSRSAIKRSDVAVDRNGTIYASITQRRPVLRIETPHGGYYVDDSQYVFPLIRAFTSYVPVITGHIPIRLEEGYRGTVSKDDSKWMNDIIRFGEFIDSHEFWNDQIQQIYIDEKGDVILYTRVGDQSVIFGSLDAIGYKFAKLDSFYQNVVPIYGWNKYSSINLKYSNQIVCKKKITHKKKTSI